jgi:hypothetical protein
MIRSEPILTKFSKPFVSNATGRKTIKDPAANIKAKAGLNTNAIANIKKYKTKKKDELSPPVENMTKKITVFKTNTLAGPPKLILLLFPAERIMNIKMRIPIRWGENWVRFASLKMKRKTKEASMRED